MRAWLVVCAALALAPCRATAAHAPADPARLERIKSHILAKLGLTSRPMPLGAPPRDVVQEILHRAQDNPAPQRVPDEHAMREIIAIAQTGNTSLNANNIKLGHVDAINIGFIAQVGNPLKCSSTEGATRELHLHYEPERLQ